MALPAGIFNTARSGRLHVVFLGKWLVNGSDWGAGDWRLAIRAYVGTGADRRTAVLGITSATAIIEVDYVGGTDVAVGMEYDGHNFGDAGTICAVNLRIACHLVTPSRATRVVTFEGMLQSLCDERLPLTLTPTPAPWLTDTNTGAFYVRPLSDLATEFQEKVGHLDENGFKASVIDPLLRQIDPNSVLALGYQQDGSGDPIILKATVRTDIPGGYIIRLNGGVPFGYYVVTYNCVPAGAVFDGLTLATAFAGVENIDWGAMGPGDTLWVCGTFRNVTLVVQTSGTAGAWFKVRLDYPADPGHIRQALAVQPTEWELLPNGEYALSVKTVNNMLFEDGERLYGPSTTSRCRTRVTSVNIETNTIVFAQPRVCFTGKEVAIPEDFLLERLPAGLTQRTIYYLIVVSYVGFPGGANVVTWTCKLAATYADAMAGVAVDLTSAGTGDAWFLWITDTGEPYFDAVPGALQPGQFGYDCVTQLLHYRPSVGTPADHAVELSNDKSNDLGSGIYMTGRSYVRIIGGREYGGMFSGGGAGSVSRCHLNGIHVVGGSNVVIDGVYVHGTRSAIVFNGTTHGVARNGRYRDLGWHACGAERTTDSEPDLILERNWISDVSRKADYGDAQGVVTNPGSHRAHQRRNFCERVGRNTRALNCGTAVIDSSDYVSIYWNWFDDCYGDVCEAGAGTGGPVRYGRVVGNVCTRGSFQTFPYDERKQDRPAFMLVAQGGTSEVFPIQIDCVAGNLIADCNYETRSDSSAVTGGVIYMRTPNTQPSTIDEVVRNAVLSPTGYVYSFHRTSSLQTSPTITTADYNLFASVPKFAEFKVGAVSPVVYDGSEIVGSTAGFWNVDQGKDGNSVLAFRAPADPVAEPTLARLEMYLRQHEEFDSYDTTDRPGVEHAGNFPIVEN